jgi:gliding motility-associated-like protein
VGWSSPPADITDLTAVPGPVDGSIQLSWTEPGASGFIGTASSYIVRVSTLNEINSDADFNNPALALPLSSFSSASSFNPGPGGSLRTELLTRLVPGVTYYFAIRANNNNSPPLEDHWVHVANTGPNAANYARAPDTPPSPPTGVSAISLVSEVDVRWNANPEWDLAGYRLWRSSGATAGTFVPIAVTTNLAYADHGLTNGVTYYYALSAFNSGVPPMESALSQWATGYPNLYSLPVDSFTATGHGLARTVDLTWVNPNPPVTQVLILREAGAAPSQSPAQNTSYSVGSPIGGATVAYIGTAGGFTDSGLTLSTTYFYEAFAQTNGVYSSGVGLSVFLSLLDMPPAGLDSSGAYAQSLKTFSASVQSTSTVVSSVTISWLPEVAYEDGTPLHNPPTAGELSGFKIYRSTGLWAPPDSTWTVPSTATSFTDPNGAGHVYRLTAVDGYGNESTPSLFIDAITGDQFKTTPDKAFVLHIMHSGVPKFNSVRATLADSWNGSQVGGLVLQAYEFTPYRTDNAKTLDPAFALPDTSIDLRFYWEVVSGNIQFAKQGVPAQTKLSNASNLGIFWFNGYTWFKLYGGVDTANGAVGLRHSYFGNFQVRMLSRTQDFTFDPSTITNRFITPNGDGKNDNVVFHVNNPAFIATTGKIFDIRGGFVADMPYDPLGMNFTWDARSNGTVVPSGVYIYQIQAGDQVFNGTVVVIK